MDLKAKIKKFKNDEIQHKNIAYDSGATNKGLYSIMNKVIKTGSRIAITISEKI
jgi:ubiquinone biosynthesis monooxygenase Coq7